MSTDYLCLSWLNYNSGFLSNVRYSVYSGTCCIKVAKLVLGLLAEAWNILYPSEQGNCSMGRCWAGGKVAVPCGARVVHRAVGETSSKCWPARGCGERWPRKPASWHPSCLVASAYWCQNKIACEWGKEESWSWLQTGCGESGGLGSVVWMGHWVM